MPQALNVQMKYFLALVLLVGACKTEMEGMLPPVVDGAVADVHGKGCVYGGKSYDQGQSFPSSDGCNSCSCGADGQVACTLMACGFDASVLPLKDSAVLGRDSAPLHKDASPISDTASGKDMGLDGPRDSGTLSDRPLILDAPQPKDAPSYCVIGGIQVPVGGSGFDGCNTCTCLAGGGLACTKKYCPPEDAGGTGCMLPTSLVFGPTGGMVIYQDSSKLSPPWSYTHQRTYIRALDPADLQCAPPLPACGTPGGNLVTAIVSDLADPEVKAAFAATTTPVFGVDHRPVDGTIYSVIRDDGKGILVGSPCASPVLSSCRPIPAGVARLVADLKTLDEKMLASAECAAFKI